MLETYIENMKITKTMLGYEDHGIFTCYLHLEGDSCGIIYGGYFLDQFNEEKRERVGTAEGLGAIAMVLNTLEVDSWEKVVGQFIRAELGGLGRPCCRIGHLIKNKWFSFEEFLTKHRGDGI